MRLRIAALVGAFALASCGGAPNADPAPKIEGAWVRLPAVSGRPAAAYFDIAAGTRAATLLKVSTPIALRTELHETTKGAGGVMSMQALDKVDIPAGGEAAFAPGGKHVMLFDVAPNLKAGDTVKLSLAFAGEAAPIEVDATLVAAGGSAPKP